MSDQDVVYSQGVMQDGAAILRDGVLMAVEEVVAALNGLPTVPPHLRVPTGRTARMLAEAEQKARVGKIVYVLAESHGEVKRLLALFGVDKAHQLGVRFECFNYHALNFDWEQMRVPGAHPNCVFLVDHWAIETQFARMLEMLHRYDLPVANTADQPEGAAA